MVSTQWSQSLSVHKICWQTGTRQIQSRQTATHRALKVSKLSHIELSKSADCHTLNFQNRQTGTHRALKVGRLSHIELSKSADWNTPSLQSRQTGTHRAFKVGKLSHIELSKSADLHKPNFQSQYSEESGFRTDHKICRQTGTHKLSQSADCHTPNFRSRQTVTHRAFKVGNLSHTELSKSAEW